MICAGVPHPCDGRCWNRPNESALLASPRSGRLIREDSWIAVATAMIQPRTGTPIRAPTPTMVAALPTAWLSQVPTGGKPAGGGVSPPAGSETLGAAIAMQEALAAPPTRPASRPPQASRTPMTAAPIVATIRMLMAAPPGCLLRPPGSEQPGDRLRLAVVGWHGHADAGDGLVAGHGRRGVGGEVGADLLPVVGQQRL